MASPHQLKKRVYDLSVEWIHDQFQACGIMGRCEASTADVESVCSTLGMETAWASLSSQSNEEYIAAFSFHPAVDLTLSRNIVTNTADILTYTFNKPAANRILEEIIERLHVITHQPTRKFIETSEEQIKIILHAYQDAQKIAATLEVNNERVFSAIHYGNFLRMYKNVPRDASLQIGCEKYGLPWPLPTRR